MRHIRIYKAIDAVARHRSIRTAAHGLAISPSALNRQIQGMEEDLGVVLFERLSRGVRLSTAGEIYLAAFRAHLAQLDRASAQISDLAGLRAGAVAVGVGPELAWGAVAQVAARYSAEFPGLDIEVKVVACDRVGDALREFDIDLYVGANPVLDEGIEVLHSQEVGVICVGAAGGRGETTRLSHLVDQALVVNSNASGLRRVLDASFAAKSIDVRYAMASDQLGPGMLGDLAEASALMIDDGAWADAPPGLRRSRIDQRDLSALYIKIARLKSRALTVGASHLAERLMETLEGA